MTATDVDFPNFLPPPPKEDSPAGKRDVKTIIDLQKNMTPERMAAVQADVTQNVFRIAGEVLGPKFTKRNFPISDARFVKVIKHGGVGVGLIKEKYKKSVPLSTVKPPHPRQRCEVVRSLLSGDALGARLLLCRLGHVTRRLANHEPLSFDEMVFERSRKCLRLDRRAGREAF